MDGGSPAFLHSVFCILVLRGVNYLPIGMRSKSRAFPFRYRQRCQHCCTSDICSSMLSDVLCLEIGLVECFDCGSDLSLRHDDVGSELSGSLAYRLCFYERCLRKRSFWRVCSSKRVCVDGCICVASPELSTKNRFPEDAGRGGGVHRSAQSPSI